MQVETKFSPNHELFFLKNTKIECGVVNSIRIEIDHNNKISVQYFLKKKNAEIFTLNLMDESECFASREELIEQL